jgi:hypothetical protein
MPFPSTLNYPCESSRPYVLRVIPYLSLPSIASFAPLRFIFPYARAPNSATNIFYFRRQRQKHDKSHTLKRKIIIAEP